MDRRWMRRAVGLTGLAVWLATVGGGAAEGTTSAESGSARAREVLAHATRYLKSLDRFRLDATLVYDVVQDDGRKLEFRSRRVVTVRRPDRLYGTTVDDAGDAHYLYYDGESLTRYDRSANLYGVLRAPGTLDATLDHLEGMGTPMPLADLLYGDLSHLASRAASAGYVGTSYLRGVHSHHLAFRGDGVDWQVWVERDDPPRVRQLLVTYRDAPGQPQWRAFISSWDTEAAAPEPVFRFRPPHRSRRIRVLADPPAGPAGDVDTQVLDERGDFR